MRSGHPARVYFSFQMSVIVLAFLTCWMPFWIQFSIVAPLCHGHQVIKPSTTIGDQCYEGKFQLFSQQKYYF
jgi:hypothetical protein